MIYFLGIVTLLAFATSAVYAYVDTSAPPSFAGYIRGWSAMGRYFGGASTFEILVAVFVGMWTGAASHTLTDISITYIKTGRVNALL